MRSLTGLKQSACSSLAWMTFIALRVAIYCTCSMSPLSAHRTFSGPTHSRLNKGQLLEMRPQHSGSLANIFFASVWQSNSVWLIGRSAEQRDGFDPNLSGAANLGTVFSPLTTTTTTQTASIRETSSTYINGVRITPISAIA